VDNETSEALDASIARHEGNLLATVPWEVDLGAHNCALCDLFTRKGCRGCPVYIKTRHINCRGTPYDTVVKARDDWDNEVGTRDAFRVAEQAEIDFLKSLRP